MLEEKTIGNYRILKEIGEGGMSYVFVAEHISLKNKKAIKMLAPHLTGASGFKERFLKEGRALAQLEHDNIVKVVDFIEQNNKTFLVMEYIEGQCLDDLIEIKGRLKEHEAIKIAKDVLNALNYAHMKHVVHRDIKPSNIIISHNGKAMLMDFGIAFMLGDKRLTSTGMNIGTSLYMSPEQITSPHNIDHRVDVYAMGVVLYEMLTGEVPFDDDSDYIVKDKHVNELPVSPRQKYQDISKAMEGILMKALEKDPDNRFHGCGEFLEFLIALESEIENSDINTNNEVNLSKSEKKLDAEIKPELADESGLIDNLDDNKGVNESNLDQHKDTESVIEKKQAESNKLIHIISIITVITILIFVIISFNQDNNNSLHTNQNDNNTQNKYNNEFTAQVDQKDVLKQPEKSIIDNEHEPIKKQISQEMEKVDKEHEKIRVPIVEENNNLPVTKKEVVIHKPTIKSIVINSLNMEFKRIRKGKFMMGTSSNEIGRDSDEIRHQVKFSKDFYMQTKETTQKQFKALMGYNPSWKSSCPKCPIESISWYKVIDFINKLNHKYGERKNGRKYRMPTEAEWEYACRAGSETPFSFGYSLYDHHANYGKKDKYGKTTLPVGSYNPNKWGLYDMHGNVSEWCSDWYTGYPSISLIDPHVAEKVKFHRKIVRGGAWNDKETSCRSGNRMRVDPSVSDANNIGFRLVMTQEE